MTNYMQENIRTRKPPWLKTRLPQGSEYEGLRNLIKEDQLHTVCQEARCPNMWMCFSCGTATFLIMGPRCTRNCSFCAVEHGSIDPPDPGEPNRVAMAAKKMNLFYVVVTSVTRDDLLDGGAEFFCATIQELRKHMPDCKIEVLIPDFNGNKDAILSVADALPDVLNHNIETCENLYLKVRPKASYAQSLELLKTIHEHNASIPTKSGMMLGMGETRKDIIHTFEDLLEVDCCMLTLGQYLQPTKNHLPVERFVTPDEFYELKKIALDMGFSQVASAPLVRSSFHAEKLYQRLVCRGRNLHYISTR